MPDFIAPKKNRDPYAALRYPVFCAYLAGWIVAVIGDQILEVAVGWDIYSRTGNPMSLGWVGLVSAAPIILLALPAGHLADRFDRRKIVLFSQTVRGLCVAGLAMISHSRGPIGAMYAILLVAAVCKAIGWPARSALMPSLVEPHDFANAVNWNSMAFQTSATAGPALGGIIVRFSVPAAYVVSAIGSVVFAVSLAGLRPRSSSHSKEPPTLKSLIAGIRFVYNTKIILATITLDLFAVLLGGATYLLPIFAKDILHVGAVGFGWLRAAPAIGALCMGLLVAHIPPMKRAGRAMLWAVAGFGVATIVFGLSRNFWLSIVMLFLAGAFDNISVLVRHTLVQVLTPDSMRGRVSAVNNIFIGASNELGGFESGLTARLFGTVVSVVGGGIGTILVVLATTSIWPQVGKFGSLVDAKPEPEPLEQI
ncbi:MAG: MFS transporter [Tepidisphaeraceae bacterium]|jgi:MFS family permease